MMCKPHSDPEARARVFISPRRLWPTVSLWILCAGLLSGGVVYAQEQNDQQEEQVDEQTEPAAAAAPPAPRRPKPTEEVMRPTEQGFRMTPRMARAMSQLFVADLGKDSDLSKDQRTQMSEALAKRIMDTARNHEELAQGSIEYFIHTTISHEIRHEKYTAETSREFAERMLPVAGIFRELVDGVNKDFEGILTAEQNKTLTKLREDFYEELDKFEGRMKRWSQGGFKEGENPFYEPPTEQQQKEAQKNGEQKAATAQMERAELVANNTVQNLDPSTWERFVNTTCQTFKLDDQQKAQAHKILDDYRAKADAIMTPEWKQKVKDNRARQFFRWSLPKDVTFAPWNWRLEYEFKEATKPLNELGRSFRKDVLAIPTPEQRDAALVDIRKRAVDNGLVAEDVDRVLATLEQN